VGVGVGLAEGLGVAVAVVVTVTVVVGLVVGVVVGVGVDVGVGSCADTAVTANPPTRVITRAREISNLSNLDFDIFERLH
jgi:hypothetical protein